ncbi:MAG: hypothetical protein RQ885_00425 [Desulfurococcales archaeon]|jgi:hypothetical protein|nr:hypothetical protein [Desulfurococcales archaeon]
MEEVARFGGVDHNIAIILSVLERLERILSDLYYRVSQASSPDWRLLLRYMADLCARHAEYIARIYYDTDLIKKMPSPEELKEIAREGRRIMGDVAEIYNRLRDSGNLEEILKAIESIEDMERIALEAYDILGKMLEAGDQMPIAMLLRVVSDECIVRRDILKELEKRTLKW